MSDNWSDIPKTLTPSQAWVGEICQVLGWDYRIKSNAGRAARMGKELREAGGTVEELQEHFGQVDLSSAWWWYRDAWQGKRGQRPTAGQLMENWGAWRLPIAVRNENSMSGMLEYVETLRQQEANGNSSASH